MHLDLLGMLETLERGLESPLAYVAPRAHDVRPDLYEHDWNNAGGRLSVPSRSGAGTSQLSGGDDWETCDVAPKARRVERLEFKADEASEILGYMTSLAQAGDGWINLLPNTGEAGKPTTLGFFTLFGGGSLGVTMCTWIPGRETRRGRSETKLGFSFSTGRNFGSELPSPKIPENLGRRAEPSSTGPYLDGSFRRVP